ncbi:MAG: hypothetical protein QOJ12_1873 [Thermoleophilales bacterium]|nr:hypothetical protein [Thermoleophilales bacterium]
MTGLSALVARSVARVPRAAVVLVVVALLVRVAFVLATPGYVPHHDDRDYDRLACGLVEGDGYSRVGPPRTAEACGDRAMHGGPTAYRPPGFPMFLAAVYTVSEPLGADRWVTARLAQALLGTAVVALLGVIAGQLWGRRTALFALGLAAVFAPGVVLGGSLLTETLFVALMLAAIAAVLADRAAGGARRWLVVAGVLCGLALLSRSNAPVLLLPLAIAVAGAGERRRLRARLGRAAVLLGIAALVAAPWTIRNAIAMHAFVPVTTEAGSTLAGTYNDSARFDAAWPGAWKPQADSPEMRSFLHPLRGDEVGQQRALVRRSLHYMAHHPVYVAQVGGWNLLRLSGLEGRDWWYFSGRTLSLPRWTADVSGVVFLLFLALAAVGACTAAARAAPRWFWLTSVLMLLSVVFIIGETRFRAPIDPFVVLLAALAVARLVPGGSARRRAPTPI